LNSYIQIAAPHLDGNEAKYVQECLDTNWISSAGQFIKEFEDGFAEFCGAQYAIATNNGTTALHLALVALGVGPGDEVIVPTLTYIASANAVRYCGATPVFADSEPIAMTIDVGDIERKVTSRTKAIIAVHLFGNPANMTAINEVAARRGIFVVEDAAEAHGASIDGKLVGNLGTCATFSFFGNKIMTTGEGGAVTTNDPILAGRLRLLRGQGMDPQRRYWFPVVGYNYRMTNIAAAIGLGQLEAVEKKLAVRRNLALTYNNALAPDERIVRPSSPPWGSSVNWLYTVLIDGLTAEGRDAVMHEMAADAIETRPVFYPMHWLPPYQGSPGSFPIAESLAARGISLPTHTQLTEGDVARVGESLLRHIAEVIGKWQ
jgi:perosamine synthetase